jgi:microcystin-dependent protein
MTAGSMTMFAGSTSSIGWLVCDGSAVDRTTYADLYSVIGTTYGAGNGSTTFNLPDMRGKGAIGYKSNETAFNAIGKTGVEKTHTLTTVEMPSHTHDVNPASVNTSSDTHTHGYDHYYDGYDGVYDYGTDAGDDQSDMRGYTTDSDTHNHSVDIPNTTSTSTGSGAAHNVLDPYIVMNFIIKY